MSVDAPTSPFEISATEPVRVGGRPIRRPPGWLGARAAIDGLACLAVAVLLLRSFLVEGYMISTGSMAPALYGYHKRVVCPTCGELFARGVAFDGASAMADDDELLGGGRHAVCPNCGQASIDVSSVPRNHGDQLLVLKNAFEFRDPRRWEVVVFRNPNHPTQAFVKRIAGLPGERVRVVDGDLYADGEICRKSFETQRAMRIPVFDADHAPHDDATWTPRWETTAGWTVADAGGERIFAWAGTENRAAASKDPAHDEPAWLTYRHRYRESGAPAASVRVSNLPLGFTLPESLDGAPVTFQADAIEPAAGLLTAVGELNATWERRLRELSADPEYQRAVAELADRSRVSPIIDRYGYNRALGLTPNAVRDVMLAAHVRLSGQGAFAVELTDGRDRVRVVAETASQTLSLVRTATGERLRSAPLPAELLDDGTLVEASMMDRQVLVAVDGTPVFAAWTYDEPHEIAPPTSSAVRLGATELTAEVRSLVLYRDVYYTSGRATNGVVSPYKLGRDEFFVLGDNSPVSLDSRSWQEGALPARLLLGKPFVVHLPSRPGTIQVGESRQTVRIPDFSRMRYIH
ncbi:MAG: signal peptidase I [Planctomycetaceae bacterium]